MLDLLIMIVFLQTIQVNDTVPCFLNETAGAHMWNNCGITEDYLKTITLGFEYATGGYFSMLLASTFIGISYIKYHKVIYPIIIGIAFIPLSYFLFPETFVAQIILLAFIALFIGVWYVFVKQTKEY